MALEGEGQIEHRLLQQLALGTELIRRDRLELRAERCVQDLHVLRIGGARVGRECVLAGEQRNRRAGEKQAGVPHEQAACGDRVGHLKERHRSLLGG